MLTKEECLEALDRRKEAYENVFKELAIEKDNQFYEDVNILEQLIEEHFDNSPLKFEELKEGEWYWDNKKKRYFKIFELDVPNKEIIAFDYWGLGFEENRFYRKEVDV